MSVTSNSPLDYEMPAPNARIVAQLNSQVGTSASLQATSPETPTVPDPVQSPEPIPFNANADTQGETPEQMQKRYDDEVDKAAEMPEVARAAAAADIARGFKFMHKAKINAAIENAVKRRNQGATGGLPKSENYICLSSEASRSDRVKAILNAVAGTMYVNSLGELCRLDVIDALQAYGDKALTVAIDNPAVAVFYGVREDGCKFRIALDAREAAYAIAGIEDSINPKSLMFNKNLRVVELRTPTPVIYRKKNGTCGVAQGYNKDLKILAGDCKIKMNMTTAEAAKIVDKFVNCYILATPGDRNRMRAMIMSPALVAGNILPARDMQSKCPAFFLQKDQVSTGASYAAACLNEIYKETGASIDVSTDCGKIEESMAVAIRSGRQIILIDNVDSSTKIESYNSLKSFVTANVVPCRSCYAAYTDVDVSKRVLVMTSLGAMLGEEWYTRSIIIKMLKREDDATYPTFNEGSLKSHIDAKRGEFLSAIFTLIKAYSDACKAAGKAVLRPTSEHRHRLGNWSAAMGWIIENCF